MKKVIVLHHQNSMYLSKEFFMLSIPNEITILFYSICLLCLLTIGIIVFGRIDDVIKINGIVRTKENVSTVKNVISGKIIELDYQPGEKVSKGDLLYKMDPSIYCAQNKNLVSEKTDYIVKLNGIKQLIDSYNKNENLVDKNDFVSYMRFESYLKKQESLVVKKQMAKLWYEEEKEKPVSLINSQSISSKEIEYKLACTELESFKASFISDLFNEKSNLTLGLKKITQNKAKLDSQYEYLTIHAPIDGYVQEISSLNVGDYLEEGKNVLNIVPNDLKSFRVEMRIPPKDIGKIKKNLKVKHTLTAFPFFEYQGAAGKITAIDPDIRTSEKYGYYYCVYADIDRIEFKNRQNVSFPIRAGLETRDRIILENNTILYFILKKMDFLY
ncbi:MAG: hypothetical protein BKP49_05505 [Treponema sp. CETP13]|nr:MAG: hypothetical protein BKP49_05505 [Treponema sp. CETP13]